MNTPLLVSLDAAWKIKDLVDVTYTKIVIQIHPETNLDTPIGERVFATMSNKSASDGPALTHN